MAKFKYFLIGFFLAGAIVKIGEGGAVAMAVAVWVGMAWAVSKLWPEKSLTIKITSDACDFMRGIKKEKVDVQVKKNIKTNEENKQKNRE